MPELYAFSNDDWGLASTSSNFNIKQFSIWPKCESNAPLILKNIKKCKKEKKKKAQTNAL